jgi:6-phosphofructokinase 1
VADARRRHRGWRRRHPDPKNPYSVTAIARAIRRRSREGLNFSIVAIAEGALSREYAARFRDAKARKAAATTDAARSRIRAELAELDQHHSGNTLRLSQELERRTGLECRVSILGYVQRGGSPSADLIEQRQFGVMVAVSDRGTRPVPLAHVAGKRKDVPLDHPWIAAARAVGTCLGT